MRETNRWIDEESDRHEQRQTESETDREMKRERDRDRRGMACSDQLDHSLRVPEGIWSAVRSLED